MAFGYTRTLPTITGSHSDFPVLLTAGSFPAAAIDGGASSIDNGGGNLRAYTDSGKATQLSLEVVTFVTGGTPDIQVWCKIPTAATSNTIFLEADAVATTQPAVGVAFGRNSVWADYEAVIHANETGTDGVFVDSTGNSHDTTLTTGATLATTTTGHPFGATWPDFDTTSAATLTSSAQILNNSAMSISAWIDPDVLSAGDGIIGNRYQSGDTEWYTLQSNGRTFAKGPTTEDLVNGSFAASTRYVTTTHDASSLDLFVNGALNADDTSIANTGGINTPVGRDYRFGTYFADASGSRYDGRAGSLKFRKLKISLNLHSTEYNNQSDPVNWGTSSAWADGGGGSVSIPVIMNQLRNQGIQ